MRNTGTKESTVDSKGVGKPFTFSSDEARFAAWQKKLRNYVAAALPGARVFMDWASDHSQPISREELEDRFGEQLRLSLQSPLQLGMAQRARRPKLRRAGSALSRSSGTGVL